MVTSQNIIQCFKDIQHDKTTKLKRPGNMRGAIRSENCDFFK